MSKLRSPRGSAGKRQVYGHIQHSRLQRPMSEETTACCKQDPGFALTWIASTCTITIMCSTFTCTIQTNNCTKKKKVCSKSLPVLYHTVPIQDQGGKDSDGNATNLETIQKHQRNAGVLEKGRYSWDMMRRFHRIKALGQSASHSV